MPSADSRVKQFKNVGKHEEMRRRRAEGSVELRKAKKEDQLMKRRNVGLEEDLDDEAPPLSPVQQSTTAPVKKAITLLTLNECKRLFDGGVLSEEETLQAVESVRRILSRNKNPPIGEVISLGLVHPLIIALQYPSSKVRMEAAWALTNIVSGTSEETLSVVQAGGVPPLVQALSSPELEVAEQAAWALGNIAGDSATLRDLIITAGALQPMLELTTKDISIDFLRTLAWTFSNFCRHKKPQPDMAMIDTILPYVVQLAHSNDKAVVTDAIWALSYVSDGPDENIQKVLDTGVLTRIVQCLRAEEKAVVAPSLRTLGNIVTGNDSQTQAVIDTGILATDLCKLMNSGFNNLAKESCWILSNVLAGNEEQIETVKQAGLLEEVVRCLDKGEFKTQHEAAWALCNLSTGGNSEQIAWLACPEVISPISNLLSAKDTKTIKVLLDTLTNILQNALKTSTLDEVTYTIEECGGVDKLEELQSHQDENVYHQAVYIIENYFNGDEDDDEGECQVEAAAEAAPGGYNFQ